jgi:hypothetical protein
MTYSYWWFGLFLPVAAALVVVYRTRRASRTMKEEIDLPLWDAQKTPRDPGSFLADPQDDTMPAYLSPPEFKAPRLPESKR